MRKGINVWSFAGGDYAQKFALAKKAGFEGVEVALDEEGELALHSSDKQIAAIKRQADDAGIALYSLASGLHWKYNLAGDDADAREKAAQNMRRQLEVAKLLGCDTILTVPGSVSVSFAPELGVTNYEKVYDRALAAMRDMAPYAQSLGVKIGLENVWNDFLLSPIETRDFLDAVGSPYVGCYFDVANVIKNGYAEHWIKILGKRIVKVHFKDYRRAVGSLDGFVDLLAGDVNWQAVTAALKSVGYDGWATAEMIPCYAQHSDTIIYNASRAMDAILGK